MPKRSQFLSMLGQSGWEQLELASKSGQASATVARTGQSVSIEIFEGGQMLAQLEATGGSARELVGNMRALRGPYVDMFGEELAWARSLEILFDMEANNVGLSKASQPIEGLLPTRKLDVFGKAKREDGST